MTSAKTIEQFFEAVAGQIENLQTQLNDATDVIGCLQTENDDLKARLKKYEDDQGK
jgi:regulator of replication initiation timing